MILTYTLGSSKAKGYKAVGAVSAHAKLFFHVSGNQAGQVTQLPLSIHTGLSLSRQTLIFSKRFSFSQEGMSCLAASLSL